MAKIYYVGDWAVLMGPLFAETPFNYTWKGTEIYNYGTWLKEALESSGEHEVNSVPSWEFYKLGPGQYEQVLAEYDLIIFSDVESKNFQLAPSFFDRAKFGKEQLSFPDRVRLTVEAVHSGKPMMFLGGWLSFNGECGKGGWGRTGLKEILPVRCLDVEDLRESTEGYRAQAAVVDHPFFEGLDLNEMPLILGYNIVQPREGCQVLARWQGENDPMLAAGRFGNGRVLAYTSDPAPHWGCNFVYWKHYNRFWLNACNWLLGRLDSKRGA
ncbi:MAG: hypothetical protein HY288_00675 [Planctomycetia bacterium]|nr:hypothetical protein [Planctomycetia bacterium]